MKTIWTGTGRRDRRSIAHYNTDPNRIALIGRRAVGFDGSFETAGEWYRVRGRRDVQPERPGCVE